jgi:DNA repair exonuclease SbcCD ATPase subunit
VFAVAFRYSVGSLFDADIGMMYLDEPTAWMDEDNVAYFAEALKRLAVEVRGKRQLVVITHHERLLPAFDQVIRVGDSGEISV